jgi:glycosyltransferase involved in cell wall biosynthesis
MRIAHVIARMNLGGTARWLEVLSTGLQEKGHEVLILTGAVQDGEVEVPGIEQLAIHRIPHLGRAVSPFDDLRAFGEIRSVLADLKPNLVNTHTAKAGVVGRAAVRSLIPNRPALVHTIHGHLLQGYFSPRAVRAVTFAERTLARASDLVLAAGDAVGRDLLIEGIVDKRKLRIVTPGVHDTKFMDRSLALASLNLKDDGRVIVGWLARIVSVKGPKLLLEVARLNPELMFLVGGDGPEREFMEATAPPNVAFVGWTDPRVFWSAADIAVLTSENEAAPYSLIEAGLAGLPAVATDVGAVGEVVIDGVNGYLLSRNAELLADTVNRLAQDFTQREMMGIQARNRALEFFSPETMVRRHLEVYSEALGIKD